MLTKDEIILQNVKAVKDKQIGFKQFARLAKEGNAKTAILAKDADLAFKEKAEQIAKECGVEVQYVNSKKSLGVASGIDVDAAIITIIKV